MKTICVKALLIFLFICFPLLLNAEGINSHNHDLIFVESSENMIENENVKPIEKEIIKNNEEIDYLKNNIGWIKDCIGVIISILTILIAFLTYRRARSTIFQPLRTDVIKRQADLLEKVVRIINNEADFIQELDYYHISICNFYLVARTYGVAFDEQIYDDIRKMTSATLYFTTKDLTLFPPLIVEEPPIEGETYDYPKTVEDRKILFENAKKGIVNIDHIELTNKHIETINTLKEISSNPWLSKALKKQLDLLLNDIDYNLRTVIPFALRVGIKELCESYDSSKNIVVLPEKVFNIAMVHSRNHHKQLICIKETIRKQLRIDKKW